jgi:hypothetical protein
MMNFWYSEQLRYLIYLLRKKCKVSWIPIKLLIQHTEIEREVLAYKKHNLLINIDLSHQGNQIYSPSSYDDFVVSVTDTNMHKKYIWCKNLPIHIKKDETWLCSGIIEIWEGSCWSIRLSQPKNRYGVGQTKYDNGFQVIKISYMNNQKGRDQENMYLCRDRDIK